MKKITHHLILLSVLLAIFIAACGGTPATSAPATSASGADSQSGTVRILIHQNEAFVDWIGPFNEKFQAKYPNIKVDVSIVKAEELATTTQTRLTANDVDVIDMFGFAQGVQPYMKNVDKPNWQTLIEAGLLMDLSDQPFVKNYDASAIKDAGTFDGKVYQVNTGRVSYSGVYYNKDLFEKNNVKVPTTWSELVAACDTFKKANIPCMTIGGKDGWPVLVGAYGLLGAEYPDQSALVEGLWQGSVKWNDTKSLEMWKKMQVYASDMIEPGASGISFDAAPGRFASGVVAMFPMGTWDAANIEKVDPNMKWGYIPFPGSDNAEENKFLFGKYDVGWVVAAKTPNKDAALKWLEFFSEPANYEAYANAVGFIPTQPTAKLKTHLFDEIQPYLANFRVGYEQYYVAPKGAGQWAAPSAAFFKPFNQWDDPQKLADQAQADLQAGLDASQ